MSFFAMWFKKPPVKGEEYVLRDKAGDPFNRGKYTVTVVDVREGWVQYKFRYGTLDSMKIGMFNFIYIEMPAAGSVIDSSGKGEA